MEISLFFVLPLISGFIFVSEFLPLRYRAARSETQRLYYYAALWGVVFSVLGGVIHYGLQAIWSKYATGIDVLYHGYLTPLLERPQSSSSASLSMKATTIRADVLVICVWALLIGLLTPVWNLTLRVIDYVLVRFFFKGNAAKAPLRALNRRAITDEIELLLAEAAPSQSPIQVTLSNSKIYVGTVIESRDPASTLESFRLQPMMSGYRDKDNGTVEYNTFYSNVLNALGAGTNSVLARSFQIAIPLDKVVMISGFDLGAFNTFQQTRPPPAPPEIQQTQISGDLKVELVRNKPPTQAAS